MTVRHCTWPAPLCANSDNALLAVVVYDDQDKFGDPNLFRDQGQILIHNNSITNTLLLGISVDAAQRDPNTNSPRPGPVRNLIDFNTAHLVPSVSIANNLIANNDAGGILFSGDLGANPQSPVPFGRIYNNTIYGGNTPTGVGIVVNQAASPTILNNVLANLASWYPGHGFVNLDADWQQRVPSQQQRCIWRLDRARWQSWSRRPRKSSSMR